MGVYQSSCAGRILADSTIVGDNEEKMELGWNERPFWRCGNGGEDIILKKGVWEVVVRAAVEDIERQCKEEEEARRRVVEDIERQCKEAEARRRVFEDIERQCKEAEEARRRVFEGIERKHKEAEEVRHRYFEGGVYGWLQSIRINEAEEKRKEKRKEISILIQRLSPAVNQMREKKRDEMLQRILEAKSLDDIINELNWIEKRLIVHRQQGHIHVQRSGFLISMFLLLPLASAQCSTCLGGRCYDTGQCILGCVPGYMNQYCDEACPSNCLNNACELNTRSATITCSAGCKSGYCGTKCTRHCPEGCLTCDRQCGSCNKTLCPTRRYGEGCRSVCSPTYEKCDRETGQCIKCRKGYFGDNCDKKCETCCSRGRNLIYKCLSGCEVCKEQDPCPDGLFGANCEVECSKKCGTSQETAGHPCNRATGECSTGCMPGYHGLTCNYTCSEHCLSGRCDRATGDCSSGCVPGYHGLNCNYTCNEFCESGLCIKHDGACASGCVSGYTQTSKSCEMLQDTGDKGAPFSNTLLIILIICVVSLQILSLVNIAHTRKLIKRNKKYFETRYADKKERECLRWNDINHSDGL